METNQQNQDEIEIDLLELLRVLCSKIGYVILAALALGLLMVLVSKVLMKPQYESTTKMYVLSKQDSSNTVTSGDLQASSLLTKDYAELIQSRQVVETVIAQLNLDLTYEQFLKKLTVTTQNDTRILSITVKDEDPYMASQIADAIRVAAADHIQNVMNTEAVNVVDEANIPDEPVSPSIKKNGLIGAVAGAFIAIIVIIVVYLTNDTIQTSEDVERYLGVSTLGIIPIREGQKKSKKKNKNGRGRKKYGRIRNVNQVVVKQEKSGYQIVEAYKSLRTNLQFCGEDKKVIAITSCTPNEGKSSVSMQLGISLAEIGKRVILIDADLRKSVLLGRTKTEKSVRGLAHFLSGQASLEDVICATNIKNFYMIYSGPFPPNPAELLGGKNFRSLLNALRKVYDYVIVDTPPLGSVIDSAIVAEICDGSIMVIESGVISYRFAQEVKSQLEKSNCPLLGVVLNKVDMQKQAYGKYGKYGQYKYYGEYGQEEDD